MTQPFLNHSAAELPLTRESTQAIKSALLRWYLLLLVLLSWASAPAFALQGNLGAHDPSTIVKDGNKYWVFTTGQGIPSKYSTDLVNWTAGPRPVFTAATRPSWITTKVPTFVNDYWAPECIFMNGKFYLYYSCSSFGSNVSGIGLATNVTLDPANPNYNWVDEGEVISSNAGSTFNAIDPAVFKEGNNVWFTYGSFFGGLSMFPLDPATGKRQGNTSTTVANGNPEAPFLTKHGNFYYMFINRGACCNGINSTYYILVGRSTSPTGPFLDQTGRDLNNNGGTVVLNVSGRYVGPGHAGIFEENGVSYFSHHYYDGDDNGFPKLGLAKLTWDAADWPQVTRDWVTPGRYEITRQGSNLVWQAQGCTGAQGDAVTQSTRTGQACQQWDFTPAGDGEYRITNAVGGLAAGVAGCSAANGAVLQLEAANNSPCRLFRIDRANDGSLVFASANGNRVVEVPFASNVSGTQLALFDYNGCSCQRWTLSLGAPLTTLASRNMANVSIYPIPATLGNFTLDLTGRKSNEAVTVEVLDMQGRVLYRRVVANPQAKTAVEAGLLPGLFLVQVRQGTGLFTQKLTVL
ncbi:family 43 glycosylhydrolase [Hymenobacter arizonensis]|uniref:Arabinan endo-1,5-alpha-L-arabinosidase n=1 Tax=Hymenobacter arizonensis TaxID=1227077 RepID=A0A1I5WXQ8_HYMAR|nr:family 43 glycosylhydrolase [Hymenobacter arizonensis]SFQ24428.1 arabinan endo-1,5-alpha-L-arabinosidase [Hymenobacter arizonensis]